MIFSVPIEKEAKRIDKNGEKNLKATSQFTGSARFVASLLPNLVNNLAEGIHKIKSRW